MIVLCAISCELVDGPMTMGSPKGRRPVRNSHDVSEAPPGQPVQDTILYLTAISYPEDYRWARDSGIGHVKADIVLFRGQELLQRVPAEGLVCPDADRHHIVSGHLITQLNSCGRLEIGMDGVSMLSLEGEGELRGIVLQGATAYTLVSYPGGGLVLRKDADTLFCSREGYLYGSLTDPSCPETGALYLDGGALEFCYAVPDDGAWRYYKVSDALQQELPGPGSDGRAADMKLASGKAYYAMETMNGCRWKPDVKVWQPGRASPYVCGDAQPLSGGAWSASLMSTYDYSMSTLGPPEGDLYAAADGTGICVIYARDGSVRLYRNGMRIPCPEGSYAYISPLCAAFAGSTPVLSFSPRDGESRPFVMMGSSRMELDICGFITSVRPSIVNH